MILVRPEVAGDVPAIDAVLLSAFRSDGEARLVTALRNAGKLIVSLVAITNDNVIGHIAFSPITFDPDIANANALGLAPLAVSEQFRRQGVGARLVKRGLEACRDLRCDTVFVLGEPRYYHRFGFRRASDAHIANEYGVDEEFMLAELRPNALAVAGATARYSSEFGIVAG